MLSGGRGRAAQRARVSDVIDPATGLPSMRMSGDGSGSGSGDGSGSGYGNSRHECNGRKETNDER